MPLSAVSSPYIRSSSARYEQGDILRDVTLVQWADIDDEHAINIIERTLQYCVVVSQECDLEHDFTSRANAARKSEDKFLDSLLICPAYPADVFRKGDHLKELQLRMESINSDNWRRLIQNNHPRYHFLAKHDTYQVPELVIDFKHYLTAPRDVLYQSRFDACYLASMEILFRESLSSRFAHYLSRIGLPDEMASA